MVEKVIVDGLVLISPKVADLTAAVAGAIAAPYKDYSTQGVDLRCQPISRGGGSPAPRHQPDVETAWAGRSTGPST